MLAWFTGDGNAQNFIGGTNTTAQAVSFVSGKLYESFSFDERDSLIRVVGFGTPIKFSFEYWVLQNSFPTAPINHLSLDPFHDPGEVSVGNGGNNALDQLRFSLKTDVSTFQIGVDNALSTGVWHFVVATYDGSIMRLYLDGEEIGSLDVLGNINPELDVFNIRC